MNILLIAPNELTIPPYQGYGGTERVVYDLALQFKQQGHTVDIICREGSRLAQYGINSIYYPVDNKLDFILKSLRNHKERYDIVHLHVFDEDYVREIAQIVSPLVTSIPYYLDEERAVQYDMFDSYYLTHSKSQAQYYQRFLSRVEGILQGIRTEHIPFSADSFESIPENEFMLDLHVKMKKRGIKKYLLLLSSISRRKGQVTAIKLAKELKIPLILAGEPKDDPQDSQVSSPDYFHHEIKSHIDEKQVFYFGSANETQKYELMRYARAFIFPTGFEDDMWQEAFGRVVAESLATGTPVVAHQSGAMEEQIIQGRNGFLFSTFEEALEKLRRIEEIDRSFCRNDAHQRLSAERFARDCEAFYKTLIEHA